MLADCRPCHGPNGNDSGGIDDINDIDHLVAAGLIVPLDSEASEIVRVMLDGSMPPASSGLPPVSEADVNSVGQYIDNPRFWPGVARPSEADAGSPASSLDAGSATPPFDAGADGG